MPLSTIQGHYCMINRLLQNNLAPKSTNLLSSIILKQFRIVGRYLFLLYSIQYLGYGIVTRQICLCHAPCQFLRCVDVHPALSDLVWLPTFAFDARELKRGQRFFQC